MKFIRHKTPESLAAWHTKGLVRDALPHMKDADAEDVAGFHEQLGLAEAHIHDAIGWAGFHGFADPEKKRIDYYASEAIPLEKVVYLLAHEAGHCVGIPAKRDRAEEDRADTYALAIGEVLIELGLMSKRHRSCLETGR